MSGIRFFFIEIRKVGAEEEQILGFSLDRRRVDVSRPGLHDKPVREFSAFTVGDIKFLLELRYSFLVTNCRSDQFLARVTHRDDNILLPFLKGSSVRNERRFVLFTGELLGEETDLSRKLLFKGRHRVCCDIVYVTLLLRSL